MVLLLLLIMAVLLAAMWFHDAREYRMKYKRTLAELGTRVMQPIRMADEDIAPAMTFKYKPGDQVIIRGQDQIMTISHTLHWHPGNKWVSELGLCWTHGGHLHRANFNNDDLLELVKAC